MPHYDDFDEMVSMIAGNEPLHDGRVVYKYRRIGTKDAARLAEAFQTNSTVTYLVLQGNDLGGEGVALLAGALLENSTVTELILWFNNIGDKGARALAGVLHTSSTSLIRLALSRNSIGEKGARALANALPFNSSLEMLNFHGNSIGPGGATAVAEGLLENSSVTYLCLTDNGIGDNGARALVLTLLRGNSTVTDIAMYDNGISQELERILRGLLKINRSARGNPREALKHKIRWLEELNEDDARLLGLERGTVEVEQRMVKIETEIGWKLNSEDGAAYEAAVSQALREMKSNSPLAVHRRRLFGRLLGSPKHGVRVASSVGKVGGRALYRKAASCGAAPRVLMNLLRAHPSLCGCRDVKHCLYPFALLATMPASEVSDVMEALVLNPSLVVKSGIFSPKNDERKRRKVVP